MSSFFTLPASQRKRKREGDTRPARRTTQDTPRATKKRREARDESISDIESEDGRAAAQEADNSVDDDSSGDDEDAAGRRTRLAEQYLENTRQQVLAEGFDAKDIDEEILAQRMGQRLKEDTAESKGKIYRLIAGEYDYTKADHAQFRADTLAVTGVAVCYPHIYTVSKDMAVIKWALPNSDQRHSPTNGRTSTKPKKLLFTKGNGKRAKHMNFEHHTGAILCVAASEDGKLVVTGGEDRKLIVWNAQDLRPLKVFTHHRDAVTAVCFRRGTNQLYSASKDRTVKVWSLDELAYVETLYGHQDEVLDVSALNQEKCVTVGSRDRTARYWRVVEESQLVFRGGGGGGPGRRSQGADDGQTDSYNEGSMDRIAMVDDEMFVTGSDNGNLSLWSILKKKAVFTYPLAHGLQPPMKPEEASAEMQPDPKVVAAPQPRWITALACIPFSDLIVSGSWDGDIRVWKITEDKRRLEALGSVGAHPDVTSNGINGHANGLANGINGNNGHTVETAGTVKGVVNDLSIFERGDDGKGGIGIVAVMGKEHRLGRWLKVEGKNHAMVFEVPRQKHVSETKQQS